MLRAMPWPPAYMGRAGVGGAGGRGPPGSARLPRAGGGWRVAAWRRGQSASAESMGPTETVEASAATGPGCQGRERRQEARLSRKLLTETALRAPCLLVLSCVWVRGMVLFEACRSRTSARRRQRHARPRLQPARRAARTGTAVRAAAVRSPAAGLRGEHWGGAGGSGSRAPAAAAAGWCGASQHDTGPAAGVRFAAAGAAAERHAALHRPRPARPASHRAQPHLAAAAAQASAAVEAGSAAA